MWPALFPYRRPGPSHAFACVRKTESGSPPPNRPGPSCWTSQTQNPVFFGIIGRTTNANDLKDSLDLSTQRTRAIASRVAQSSVNGKNGFALPIDPQTGAPVVTDDVDLEQEMTSLADEQLRYETAEKLLEKTYAQLRTSMK
jgi:hypothetical protein